MPADPELIERIEQILRAKFPHDTVDVSPSGIAGNIHVVVMSRRFDGMTEREKQEHLWGIIDGSDLGEEQKQHITLIVPLSPAEVK